jgi:uncharacterized LabA/DUF88 family protein
MVKVRVFVDYSNLRESWRRQCPDAWLEWAGLPKALLPRLIDPATGEPFRNMDFRGVSIYASVDRAHAARDREDREEWLTNTLDQKPGFTVKLFQREALWRDCPEGHGALRYPERGVDTQIACDLLSLAMRDHYDVGVIVSDDADFIPAVEAVQDILDRRIFHLGFQGGGQALPAAAWSHILLDSLLRDVSRPRREERAAAVPASTAEAMGVAG